MRPAVSPRCVCSGRLPAMHARRERPAEAAAAQPRVPAALRARGRRERRARVPRLELGLQAAASRAQYALQCARTRTRTLRSLRWASCGTGSCEEFIAGRARWRCQPSAITSTWFSCPAALLQRLLAEQFGSGSRAPKMASPLRATFVKAHVSARASNARGRGRTNHLLLVRLIETPLLSASSENDRY